MDHQIETLQKLIQKEHREVAILEAQLEVARERTKRKRQWRDTHSIKYDPDRVYVPTPTPSPVASTISSSLSSNLSPSKRLVPPSEISNSTASTSYTLPHDLFDLLEVLTNPPPSSHSHPNDNHNHINPETDVVRKRDEEDDVSFRLLPLLGGICFTHISQPVSSIQKHTQTQNKIVYTYDLDGYVMIGNYKFHIQIVIATITRK